MAEKPNPLTPEQLQQAAAQLFGNPDHGVKVRGVVMSCEEPSELSGTSAKGKPYKFIARRIQLSCKGQNCVVSETRDRLQDFAPVKVYDEYSGIVVSARMDGPQLVLRVA